jgi:hypothetical protein
LDGEFNSPPSPPLKPLANQLHRRFCFVPQTVIVACESKSESKTEENHMAVEIFTSEKQYLSSHYKFIGNQAEVARIIRAHVRNCTTLLEPIQSKKKLLSYFKYGADTLPELEEQVKNDGYRLTKKCHCMRNITQN